jgi:DNA-binding NarL/FixJ family response regulator
VSDRPITLVLIDEDPIFRLGLVTALMSTNRVQILAQLDSPQEIDTLFNQSLPDIILLDPLFLENTSQGWILCQKIKRNYPGVKICLLTATLEYGKLIQARQQGIEGYFPKGTSINSLIEGLQEIVAGKICWTDLSFFQGYLKLTRKNRWLLGIFQSGLAQIDSNIVILNEQFEQSPLSQFDILFLEGRKRELRTARWFVQKIMPNKLKLTAQLTAKEKLTSSPQVSPLAKISSVNALVNSDIPIESKNSSSITIFSNTLEKLQAGVNNITDIPLELDILRTERKQELLILILNQFQNLLTELNSLNVTAEQLPDDTSLMLVEIWQASTLAFFGKYCSPKGNFKLNNIQEILNNYKILIQTEALNKIPFTQELLHYLLFSENLIIDQVSYRAKSPEAEVRAEIYLQNLIIQVANGVMIFILNYFSDNEEIKQVLYTEKMLSSREIAKFRNNLAWRYQFTKYWQEPQYIFESQYPLFYLTFPGINTTNIYSPRQLELSQLQGLPLATTIFLELRDALSPRLRSLVKFLGNGFVFLLTQVIGRAIGLVVRGILQGVGNTWQETRYGKNRSRENSNF